ncbi:cytochrome P450 6k1-like [Planococcus citri]|uniref:cytochrome P450 6k1-like n=1 Tax=Planococcus citri TaxID=170843 RepID=UPI0031F9D3DF
MKKPLWDLYKDIYEKHASNRFVGMYNIHKPTVLIRDPELFKMILVKDFSYFQDRGISLNKEADPMSTNLFNSSGKHVYTLRGPTPGGELRSPPSLYTCSSFKEHYWTYFFGSSFHNEIHLQLRSNLMQSSQTRHIYLSFKPSMTNNGQFGENCEKIRGANRNRKKPMKLMFPLLKKCAEDIKPALMKYYEQGEDFEAKDLSARFGTDVIGSCAFGVDTHSLLDPESEFRNVGRLMTKPRWQLIFRMLFPNLPTKVIKLFKLFFFNEEMCNYFEKIVKDLVKYREENNVTRGDFLDILIALKNQKEREKLEDQQAEADLAKFMAQIGNKKTIKSDVEMSIELMAAQCFIFFVAGFEGSSNTIMFALFYLAENPHIQNKLRQEILSALETNGGELSYEMMRNIPYLNMVIEETFRKIPAGAVLFRSCTENYKIPESNAVIKKGTQVIIPLLALHNDRKYFEKPEEFYPEHFSSEAKLNRHNFAFLPFGEGPRVCIAERFGRMQVIVGLIYLLKDFSFELSPKTKVPLELETTGGVAVKGGMWMKCRPL